MMLRRALASGLSAAVATAGVAALAVTAGPTNQVLGHLVDHTLAQGPLMLLAHTLGAVALGLWLAAGESALWHLLVLASVRARVAVTLQVALLPLRASALGGLDARLGLEDELLGPTCDLLRADVEHRVAVLVDARLGDRLAPGREHVE